MCYQVSSSDDPNFLDIDSFYTEERCGPKSEVRATFRIAKISRNIKFILQVRWNEIIIYSVINNKN